MSLKTRCLAGMLFLLLSCCCFSRVMAQKTNNGYLSEWKKAEALQEKGLTRSSLQQVEQIYRSAKKNRNEVQVIKALLFKINLERNIEEDASIKAIGSAENEIKTAKEASKAILQSIAAQLYLDYFRQNRYRIYQRTNTSGFEKKNIATWTSDDFNQKITGLFAASLEDEVLLQHTKLAPYDALILKGNARYLRPTLYDLLAHRALEYFKTDEPDITRAAYAFEIKDTMAFAPAAPFIHWQFITKDTASLHQKALIIFQKLLAFHEHDSQKDALIDADMERISFVNQYAVMQHKKDLYLKALRHLAANYPSSPASAQALFLVAQTIYSEAVEAGRQTPDSPRFRVTESKAMLDLLVKKFPESEGGINAQNLLKTILHPSMNVTTEKVNIPGQPFRALVTYQNFHTIYFRIIPLTPELKKSLQQDGDNDRVFTRLTSEKFIRSWKQDLPEREDYLSHSVEVKIDALPVGEYALISSAGEGFSLVNNPLAAQYFHVSGISFVNRGLSYFVLDRTTGHPLGGATVQVWNHQYSYSSRSDSLIKEETGITDKNGFFKLHPPLKKEENRNILLDITYQKDQLFLDDNQYVYYNLFHQNQDEPRYEDQKDFDKDHATLFLFTDRSIYRPGQTVFFKGIGVTKDRKTKKSVLLQSKDSLTIVLSGANGRRTDSIKVLLNDFGSFSGRFKIPAGQLNGEFSVEAEAYDHSSVSFSVEEYKRPRFFTEFETVKGSFRIGDTVSITGFAKAYAGNDIDAGRVTYRVTRIPRFLYPWMFWKTRIPLAKSLEITHGEMMTGVNGRFIIRFAAIPDESLDPRTDPVFDYKVEAEVTDINGESRDADITVPLGYKALNLQIILPQGDIIDKDSLQNMVISSKNLSGEPEAVTADVRIYPLQAPGRLIRERLWEEPDQFIFNKNEYIRYFPHDEYKNETKKETWQRGQIIYEKRDSVTRGHSLFSMDASIFHQGYYVVVATAEDRFGQEVKDIRYFQVYEPQSAGLPAPAYLWDHVEKDTLQPGETAHIITGTSAKDLFIIQEEDKGAPGGSEEFLRYSLSNGKKTLSFPVSEKDRGGFRVNRFFVKDNRFYAVSDKIGVPWSNKELRISFDTYRDKTLPGSKEKWKVTIKGNKGQKVAAEMLAAMYDESLDQFRPHSWRVPDVWPVNDSFDPWRAGLNFTAVHSLEWSVNENYILQKEKTYDALKYLPQYHLLLGYRTDVRIAGPEMMKEKEMVLPTDTTTISRDGNKIPAALMDQSPAQFRKNFNETAFFFPALRTDEEGNIEFSFTMPEALTQWKLMLLAHTRELETGYAEKTVITQKDLMVQPNAPRFLREGDHMQFSAKIVNLSAKELRGTAGFHLFHTSSMAPADSLFKNLSSQQAFTVAAGQSTLVTFSCKVPENYEDAVTYRIVAQAGSFSDGEEAAVPVVSNRVLVTETLPLPMQGDGTTGFTFEKLRNEKKSPTLANYGLTVEYTTNPAWYALQSLPYLLEYPDECTEQTFNRYYAGSMASKIIQSSAKIKAVFEKWTADTAALRGNLQKNEELKSVLLQETPWLLQAGDEAQQMEHLAMLLDSTKMSLQLQSALNRLKESQSPNGGLVWFKGGPDDRYITQYILTGIGQLNRLQALPATDIKQLQSIANKALPYADRLLKEDYEQLLKSKTDLRKDHLSPVQIQYLYMHSFFPEIPVAKETQAAWRYYLQQAKKYWLHENKYLQGMIAVFLNRTNEAALAKEMIRSLKENAIDNKETGMYWKEWDHPGYRWFQAPVEAQSLMIEAFSEIDNDQGTIAKLKTWLLKNKQTNHWESTRATADACYALLLNGTGLLAPEKTVTLQLGPLTLKNSDEGKVAGTGYFKYRVNADSIKPEMGNIKVTVSANPAPAAEERNQAAPSWGAVYWQYFENLDQITFSETPLKASKRLFVEKNTAKGPVLIPVNEEDTLHPGDKIEVRITLQADRDLEYVDMKDMRASCMEPAHVISGYQYQDGLGYYETTKDVSTHFYFDHLYRGTYVFEYPLLVTHAGNFSNGITTVQCMYAPEFTAHSEGVRVNVSTGK